jgi:hypothetical protein
LKPGIPVETGRSQSQDVISWLGYTGFGCPVLPENSELDASFRSVNCMCRTSQPQGNFSSLRSNAGFSSADGESGGAKFDHGSGGIVLLRAA